MRTHLLVYSSLAILIVGCNHSTALDVASNACPPPPGAGGYPSECCDSAGNVESQCNGYSTSPSTPVAVDTGNTGSQTSSAVDSGNSGLNWVNGNSSGSLFVQGSSDLGTSSSGGAAGVASNLYPGSANSSAATGITGYDSSAFRQNSNSSGASSSGGITANTGAATTGSATTGAGGSGALGSNPTSALDSGALSSLGSNALGNSGAQGSASGAGSGQDGTSANAGSSGSGDASTDVNGTADATPRGTGAGTGGGARNPANSGNGAFQWDDTKGVDQASLKDQGFRPGELGTMRGTDPADYFARLDVDDSLFKKVTATYQMKAIQWTMSAANESAAAVRGLAGTRTAPNAAQMSGKLSSPTTGKSRKP